MSITMKNPNTILLAGDSTRVVGDIPAGEVITPGMLVQLYDDGGVKKWKKNASATEICPKFIALNSPAMNKGIDDDYAIGDRLPVYPLRSGDVWWGLIGSGQSITEGDLLQSAGGGLVKTATATTADANLAHFQAMDTPGAVIITTRVRLQVID